MRWVWVLDIFSSKRNKGSDAYFIQGRSEGGDGEREKIGKNPRGSRILDGLMD